MKAPSIAALLPLVGNAHMRPDLHLNTANEIAAEIQRIWRLEKTAGQLTEYRSVVEHRIGARVKVSATEVKLLAINELIEGHGIECAETLRTNEWADYINTGDTYNPTVVRWRGRLYLTTWGDFVERQARVKFK